jgi:hypothetical protein
VVYTHHERWKRHLRQYDEAVELHDNGHGGVTFHVPRRWIRLPRPPRVASTAQLASIRRAGARSQRAKSGNP